MAGKSRIDRLQPEVKTHIQKRLREGRLTLDELIADLHTHFPAHAAQGELPSRSSVGRYSKSLNEMAGRIREQQAMASVLVEELGENPDDKAGALMVQSITTLTTHASLMAAGEEDVDIESVRKLARAAKDVIQARKVDRHERLAIRQAAREELLAEQRNKLDALGKSGEVDPATLKKVIQAAYGMGV
ncbi:MAG: DUF3486 family protein [Comamonas sp.]